jgi:hypothetical protein
MDYVSSVVVVVVYWLTVYPMNLMMFVADVVVVVEYCSLCLIENHHWMIGS